MRRCGPGVLLLVLAVFWPLRVAYAVQQYVVQQGDTLWRIAHRLGVTPANLANANHLSLDATIHPGLRLIIPEAAPADRPRPSLAAPEYVVHQGDTLWRIAHRFGVTPETLASANRLSLDSTIYPGLRLMIPGAPALGARQAVSAQQAGPEHPIAPAPAVPASPARAAPPSRGARFTSAVVRIATGYLGRPFQWGGDGNRGFDCSGLVWRVYATLGFDLPHSSFGQYLAGVPVSQGELAPGDLVFFHTYASGPSHVGIYLGDRRFIHAASPARGVIVSSLDDPYYRDRYLGARRL